MKTSEKIFTSVGVLILAILITYAIWKDREIEENFIYTLGKVYSIQDTENGQIYDFKYYINKR